MERVPENREYNGQILRRAYDFQNLLKRLNASEKRIIWMIQLIKEMTPTYVLFIAVPSVI